MYHQNTLKIFSSQYVVMFAVTTVIMIGRVPMAEGHSSCYQNNSENGNNSSCCQFCLNLVNSSHTHVFLEFPRFWHLPPHNIVYCIISCANEKYYLSIVILAWGIFNCILCNLADKYCTSCNQTTEALKLNFITLKKYSHPPLNGMPPPFDMLLAG